MCPSKNLNWISRLDGPAAVFLSIYFETTFTSTEATSTGTLMCMFEGQKMLKIVLNHTILKKICFYGSHAHLKMVPVIL